MMLLPFLMMARPLGKLVFLGMLPSLGMLLSAPFKEGCPNTVKLLRGLMPAGKGGRPDAPVCNRMAHERFVNEGRECKQQTLK